MWNITKIPESIQDKLQGINLKKHFYKFMSFNFFSFFLQLEYLFFSWNESNSFPTDSSLNL